jgi:hypothetical protein
VLLRNLGANGGEILREGSGGGECDEKRDERLLHGAGW